MEKIRIRKRNGDLEPLDITRIQEKTINATFGVAGTSQSELEVSMQMKFTDGMLSEDIQNHITSTAVDMIDIDRPNYTFVASRSFLYNLYHKVGALFGSKKGKPYAHSLKDYLEYGVECGKINESFYRSFDLDDLNNYIVPDRDFNFNYLGVKTLFDRYLLKNSNGKTFELPQHMFMAIAMFLAQEEKPEIRDQSAKDFYDVISNFEVMLATPTLSNARTNRNQLSSCYQGVTPDVIEGIFDTYKDQSLLSKFGGGIGWDWALARGSNSPIDDNQNAAGGVVPWMKIENDIALAVDQLGTRKGAIAVYIEPWHMDIEDFLDLKKNSGEDRRRAHDLFPALWIPDLFMERVIKDDDWTLFDPYEVAILHNTDGSRFNELYEQFERDETISKKVIKAKALWKKILVSYYESGSPFLTFKDNANERNQNSHIGQIKASNLCTEIFQNTKPNEYVVKVETATGDYTFKEEEIVNIILKDGSLSSKKAKKLSNIDVISTEDGPKRILFTSKVIGEYGETLVCNLASVNLSRINTKEDFERVVPVAMRMLDNVIDINFYPIKQGYLHNMKYRAVGLGVMGEAEFLAKKGVHWGSRQHFNEIDKIMEMFSYNAINASAMLATEKGSYPAFEGSNWSKGIMPIDTIKHSVESLTDNKTYIYNWEELKNRVKKDGIRNGYLMAIAPTSSISILVGTTQAIEPVYKRKWYEENLSGLIPVVAPGLSPDTWEYYVPAFEIDQIKLIQAAAIRQKWLDQGQSLNVFMDKDKASLKYLDEIYKLAWKLGAKSTYYLRSQSADSNKAKAGYEAKVEGKVENEGKDVVDRSVECSGCQ